MTYLNSSGETFVEQPGAQLTVDAWGLDSITRKWSGKVANIPDFIATLRKNRNLPDAEYNALTLTSYTISKGRAWAEVDINYKGTFDGKLPAPIFTGGGMTTQTVQLDYKDTVKEQLSAALGVTYTKPTTTLTYKAPSIGIKYVLRKRPALASYPQELGGVTPTLQIVNQTGARGGIAIVPLSQPRISNVPVYYGVDPETGEVVAAPFPAQEYLFNGIANIVNEGPTWTPEGQYYLCEEKNQVVIMPFDFASLLWNINLNQSQT